MPESSIQAFEDKGKVRLSGMIVSTDEVPLEEIEMLSPRFINHNVVHKHVVPQENPQSEVVAQIDETEIKEFVDPDDGKTKTGLFAKTGPLFDYTDFQRKTIEYVTLKDEDRDPIKFSVSKQKFGASKDDVPMHSVPLELTLTTIPYCQKCKASVEKMENEEEKRKARILELENALKKAIGKADKFEKEVKELQEKQKAEKVDEKGKANVDSFEKHVATIKKTYEEQVKAVTQEMEAYKQELEKEREARRKAPVLAQISKFEKDAWLQEKVYPNLSLEELSDRAKYVQEHNDNTPQPYISRMEATRNEANKKMSEFHKATVENLEAQDPILAKLVRGENLTQEEKFRLGV